MQHFSEDIIRETMQHFPENIIAGGKKHKIISEKAFRHMNVSEGLGYFSRVRKAQGLPP